MNSINSLKRVSAFISQLHVLKSFFERYVIQLQDYSSNNMSLDSFLLQDEMLLELIEEFNGFQQRAHSERVLELLECEMNALEIIEELYEWLVQYTKAICSKSQELGLGDYDYNKFIKEQLLKEQQRFNERMKSEEKRFKNRSKGIVNVYVDEDCDTIKKEQDCHKSTWSPIQNISSSNQANQSKFSHFPQVSNCNEFIKSSESQNEFDKENSNFELETEPRFVHKSYSTISPVTNVQMDASPLQTRTRRSLSKPMTPIQKVVSPAPSDNEAIDSQIQHLRIQFRQFLFKEAFQAVSRLNDFAPQLTDLDSQIKQHKSQLEQHLLDVKELLNRHNEVGKQLETHKYMFSSSSVAQRAIFDHWRQDELIF